MNQENQQVWCFLVSRNKKNDQRVVVAPDFMCEQNCASVIGYAAGGEVTGKDTAYYQRVIDSKVGDLTLVVRVTEAVAKEMGIAGDGFLKDERGRFIDLIEGILFKGDVPQTNIVVNSEDFDKVREQVVEHYRQFWNETDPIPTYPSQSFPLLAKKSDDNGFRLIKLDDYIAGSQPGNDSPPEKPGSDRSISQSWQSKILKEFNNQEINSIALSPDGQKIAIRYEQRKIVVVQDFVDHQLLDKRSLGNATPIVIDSTGTLLATCVIENCDENNIKLWDLNTKESKKLGSNGIGGLNTRVRAIAFSPNDEMVISGDDNGNIKLWDVPTGGEISTKPTPKHDTKITCMAVDKKNKILASGDQKGNIKIWEIGVVNLREKMTIDEAHKLPVNSLAFSPDGQILVSASGDGPIKLWNMKTGEPYDRLQIQHSTLVNSVAFSPDGRLIASGDDGGIIKLWNLKDERSVVLPNTHDKAVTSVVFTPDGKLISGGKDGKLIKWEPV